MQFKQMRSEVARLLRIHGVDLGTGPPEVRQAAARKMFAPPDPRRPRQPPEPIELHEPPTFIRFSLGTRMMRSLFYPEQRRYLRILTDANSTYHNANAPGTSRINIIVGDQLVLRGSTPLQGGRMRAIVEGSNSAQPGPHGNVAC